MRTVALRYALAPACVLLAMLVYLSPARSALSLAGLFVFAVLAAAWFGGVGPGFVAAVLATFTLPQLIAVGYPLLGGFLDLPRFITFSIAGVAVGWWSLRRRRVEAALRQQERYARAMDASDHGFWDWIPAGDRVYGSPRLLEIYGFAPGTKFAGREDLLARIPFHPEDRAPLVQAIADHFAGKTARFDIETRVIRNGQTRWVHLTGVTTRDASGAVVRWTGTVRDMTDRKRGEEALRNSEQRYALAMEAAGDGHTDWDLVTGEFYISPRLLEIVGHPPGAGFADRADWVRRFPFHPEDRPKWEAAIAAHFAGRESHFKMELRIVVRGEVRWTAFHFLSTRDAVGKPIRWTGSIGDITEQKRTEEALRASEERSSLAMEAAEEGYVDSDVDTDQFVTSERLNEIFGVPRGTRFIDRSEFLKYFRFYGDDAKTYGDMISAVHTQGGPDRYEFEFRIVLPSGEMRWLWTRGKVTRDAGGRARRRIGVVADITARKLAEEALRTSEDRFARAVAGSYDGVWDIDFVGRTVFLSARTRELGGLPPGPEVVPLDGWFEALPLHPDDRARRFAAVEAHLSGQAPVYEGEFRMLQRDGVYRWCRLHGVCVRDAYGKPLRMAGSISDIDARRRAEDALRESEARYERVVAATEAGFWDWDITQDKYYVSPRLLEMAGLPPDTVIAGRADFQARVPLHPEDLEKWKQAMEALFASGGSRLSMELRVILGAETRWYRLDGMCFRDAAGKVVRWTGSAIDVTPRKLAEEALRASEQRYSLAMEASEEGHFDINLDTDEIFASERFNEIFGFAPGTRLGTRTANLKQMRFYGGDADTYHAAINATLAKDAPERYQFEYRIQRPSGEMRWIRTLGKVTRDADGRARRRTGMVADITDAKLAEEALRESEKRYERAMDSSNVGYFDWIPAVDKIYTSPRLNEIYGFAPGTTFVRRDDLLARIPFHPEDRPPLMRAYADHVAGKTARYGVEVRFIRDGETRWASLTGLVARDASGAMVRWSGTVRDVTERKRSELALRQSEERYELAMAASESGYWDWDIPTGRYFVSPRAYELAGHPPGTTWTRRDDYKAHNMHPEDFARWEAARQELFAGTGERLAMEVRYIVRGETRWHNLQAIVRRDDTGKVVRWTGSATDITARKQAEEASRDSEARKSAMFETALDCIISIDHEGRVVEFNPAAERTFGYGRAEAMGKELAELIIPPRLRAQHRQGLARYLKGGEARVLDRRTEIAAVRADGSEFLVELSVTRIATEGAPLFTAYLRDITERKRIEEALRQSEERHALVVGGSNEGIFDWDLLNDRVYVSHRAQELFGLPRGDLWRPRRDWRHILNFHPDDAPRLHDSIKAHIEGVRPTYDEQFRIVMPDGGLRWFRQRGIALRDASGKAYRVVGSIGDVTEKHQAAEDLSSLERKLRVAQRLEAMGTLAGGIAHDFNNLLGAILGYGEMALRDAPKGGRLARDIDSIIVAGERGRALVDRVLAFSRSAVGERAPVHVERVVREALDLISAKLPPSVTVHPRLHAGLAAVLGDATQVHQVVTNLATNAIQAMPAGGKLRVELAIERVEAPRAVTIGGLGAGEYVVLTVADTGTGIAPELVERIFDPFFTTKEVGTGTGLGLSLVHGIVTELGGAIDVASALGTGSTFTVHLPRSGDAVQPSDEKESALPRGAGQRVLIVDDEEPLVQLATRTLADLGYVPIGFTSSAAALEAFRADPERFDAVITDQRMPEMSGATLIREVRGMRSSMPVVLMSGYLGATEVKADEVLQKPLSARDLAVSLARVLQL